MHELDFSRNYNAFIDQALVTQLISENSDFHLRYPDPEQKAVTAALASFYELSASNFLVGAGATELIFTLPYIFGQRAIVFDPSFWEYAEANYRAQVPTIRIALEKNTFEIPQSHLQKNLENGDAVYVCNPNNPTSILHERRQLVNLLEEHPEIYFIIDETYLLFREDYSYLTLVSDIQRLKNLIVVTSLSKFFSVPGLRCGFLASHPSNVEHYKKRSIPYLLNPLVEILVPAFLANTRSIEKSRQENTMARLSVVDELHTRFKGKLHIIHPQTNYILIKSMTQKNGDDLADFLRQKNIIVRKGSEFQNLGSDWVRIGIKNRDDNHMLLVALTEFFDQVDNER